MKKLLVVVAWVLSVLGAQAEEGIEIAVAETRAAIIALQKYPDLAVASTKLRISYEAILAKLKKEKDGMLNDPQWPLLVAEKAFLDVPATGGGARVLGLTKLEKYEHDISRKIKSSSKSEKISGRHNHFFHQYHLKEAARQVKQACAARPDLAFLDAVSASMQMMIFEID